MSHQESPSEHHPISQPELQQVSFPHTLRNDGRALTHLDETGKTYLEPLQPHDFAFSDCLRRDGFSTAETIETADGTRMLRFSENTDIIPFANILNASLRLEDGKEETAEVTRRLADLLQGVYKRYGRLPGIGTVDDIAVERASGKVELLAPFTTSAEHTPATILDRVRADAVARSKSADEVDVLQGSFMRAYKELRS